MFTILKQMNRNNHVLNNSSLFFYSKHSTSPSEYNYRRGDQVLYCSFCRAANVTTETIPDAPRQDNVSAVYIMKRWSRHNSAVLIQTHDRV